MSAVMEGIEESKDVSKTDEDVSKTLDNESKTLNGGESKISEEPSKDDKVANMSELSKESNASAAPAKINDVTGVANESGDNEGSASGDASGDANGDASGGVSKNSLPSGSNDSKPLGAIDEGDDIFKPDCSIFQPGRENDSVLFQDPSRSLQGKVFSPLRGDAA